MITKLSIYLIPSLIVATSCQFAMDMMKPDISFGDDNDRFDITSMMRKQNRMFRQRAKDGYRRQISRRYNNEELDEKLKVFEEAFKRITSRHSVDGRRNVEGNDANFAYHDEMYSKEGGGVTDFESNLKQFERSRPSDDYDDYRRAQKYIDRLHGGKSRRAGDPEREILMHYAFPIDLTVKGYLQAPLVK